MALYQKVINEGLSVRQTEYLVKKYSQKISKIKINKNTKLKLQLVDLEKSLISI